MELSTLTAISVIDGRYHTKTAPLQALFSEFGLMKYRLSVEIHWLMALAQCHTIEEIGPLNACNQALLLSLIDNFNLEDAKQIKNLERLTRHDVKAIEYFLQKKLACYDDLKPLQCFIHFGCTSEDINNLAYAMIIHTARESLLIDHMNAIISQITQLAYQYADIAMLARTHGQAASPTTMGKEMAVFAKRLQHQRDQFATTTIQGKCNGASGNYNAHVVAYPKLAWQQLSQQFVEKLGLQWSSHTTQIEPHDWLASLLHAQIRFNNILIDFCRDLWTYTALGYFKQKSSPHEIGSSTMPHKINPIDFENAEGNLGLANAVMGHLANKLTISRLQRDLSDSTVLRNLGAGFSYVLIAYSAIKQGIEKLVISPQRINQDLAQNWQVITEAIQTTMRRYGIKEAYEQLKILSQGKILEQKQLHHFIAKLALPADVKKQLMALTPQNYLGLAKELARKL